MKIGSHMNASTVCTVFQHDGSCIMLFYFYQVTPSTSNCQNNSTVSFTQAQLNDPSFVVEVNVTQLMPHVQYLVDVTPFNEEGPGTVDQHLTLTTDSEGKWFVRQSTLSNRDSQIAERVTAILERWTGPEPHH